MLELNIHICFTVRRNAGAIDPIDLLDLRERCAASAVRALQP
jgi:hypothetical protein